MTLRFARSPLLPAIEGLGIQVVFKMLWKKLKKIIERLQRQVVSQMPMPRLEHDKS
jgi:sensor domain CHASE-containing protein